VIRGGVAVSAIAVAAWLPARAAANTSGTLSSNELAAVDALGAAILVAAGLPQSALAGSGIQTSQDIAAGYGTLDVPSQAAIATVLDAIESAPSAGLFSTLSSSDQQAALVQFLAPYQPPAVDPNAVSALQGYYSLVAAGNANVVSEESDGSIPDEIDQPTGPPPDDLPEVPLLTFPAPPPPTPAQILATTFYIGLQLVSSPLDTTPPPSPPSEPAVSPVLAIALIDWTLASAPEAVLPENLVDDLASTFSSDDPDTENTMPPPTPPIAPPLTPALATWILNP
jgi:hypothetical protein